MASGARRIRGILRRSASLEDAAVRAQLALLKSARRDVLRALGSSFGFNRWHLGQVLAGINGELARYGRQAVSRAADDATAAMSLGLEMLGTDMFAVSPELLAAVLDVTTDQTRAVWGELGTQLKATIRRATLGVTDPYASMKTLARAIQDPKTFGTAETRAEVIIRTETGRAFSLATQDGMEQATTAGVKLRKWWLAHVDKRTRESHIAAGERYSEDNAIRVDRPFLVGGARLMFPGDPSGPAEETINCRCVSVPAILED
jgi:uncharacterized protein with gpF-like domain